MKYNYFVPSDYGEFIDNCQKYFSYPEPGVFISVPKNGIERRVEQLVQDHSKEFDRPLVHIHISPAFEDTQSIVNHIRLQGFDIGKDPVNILITNPDYFLKSATSYVIDELVRMQYKNNQLGLIFFFECDITHPKRAKQFQSTHIFSQLPVYLPLYSIQDSKQFIAYCCKNWSISLPKTVENIVIKECGGHLWLLKHGVRLYRENKQTNIHNLINHDSMLFRLEQIVSYFNTEEINALACPQRALPSILNYLEHIGLIKKHTCTLILLKRFCENNLNTNTLLVKDSTVLVNGVPVTTLFSKQEQILLLYFISHKGKVVSRDTIAKLLWKNQSYDNYSTWAIEQVIRRLRIKLQKMEAEQTLKSVRNKGYVLI